MSFSPSLKFISLAYLPIWRKSVQDTGRKLVVTNGCFDVLHIGHTTYLENARALEDILLVGVTGDNSVKQLKGINRPINNENDRAGVLAALRAVDYVCIFPELTALNFLSLAKPDYYVKGGDNTLETINQEEKRLIEDLGGKVQIVPGVPNRSTTWLLKNIENKK